VRGNVCQGLEANVTLTYPTHILADSRYSGGLPEEDTSSKSVNDLTYGLLILGSIKKRIIIKSVCEPLVLPRSEAKQHYPMRMK
jgi:hypothetical protein